MLRVSLHVVQGFDFEGGHLADKGLAPAGAVVSAPLHKHAVSLNFTRVELTAKYAVADRWGVWFRLPYDIKDQRVEIAPLVAATPTELEAIARNGNIHHRDEIYSGISDPLLLVARQQSGLFRQGDLLQVAVGSSVPLGNTEENPYRAADEGRRHLHIQFGTGTFDPLVELFYTAPFAWNFSLSGFAISRLPLYKNDKTYQGPLESTLGLGARYSVTQRLSVRGNYSVFYQSFAHWDGERDENSGLVSHNAMVGIGFPLSAGTIATVDFRIPLSQRTLAEEGDVFEQGPTFLLSVSHPFRR